MKNRWKVTVLGILAIAATGVVVILGCGIYGAFQVYDYAKYYSDPDWVNSRTQMTKFEFRGQSTMVRFSSDSKYLIASIDSFSKWEAKEWRGEVRIWELTTKEELHCERFDKIVKGMSVYPDGKKLLVATSNAVAGQPRNVAEISIFELPSFRLLERWEIGKTIHANGTRISPDGKWIAVQAKDSFEHAAAWELVIFESVGLKEVTRIGGLFHMTSFEFTPDSKYVVGAYYLQPINHSKSTLDTFEVATGKQLRSRRGLGSVPLEQVGGRLLICGWPNVEQWVSLDEHRFFAENVKRNSDVQHVHSPDCRYLMIMNCEFLRNTPLKTEVALLDSKSQSLIKVYRDNSGRRVGPSSGAFSPDGKYFAVGRTAEVPGPEMGDVLLFTVPE